VPFFDFWLGFFQKSYDQSSAIAQRLSNWVDNIKHTAQDFMHCIITELAILAAAINISRLEPPSHISAPAPGPPCAIVASVNGGPASIGFVMAHVGDTLTLKTAGTFVTKPELLINGNPHSLTLPINLIADKAGVWTVTAENNDCSANILEISVYDSKPHYPKSIH
jgi:hypothetical protein